ncbi:hypothetical protein D5018_09150 [Parashewanella curva]|uniref:Uncharacterized protein n=1 Tax=Parashewanella curva TaxID=2338552 RepID=A0A3L8PXD7_9GAMM|nr:hypothetical protein [Parashewanella curva]RLV59964.1 hypothetical protein D5018_09150 [Parashewanella curva]
MAVSRILEHLIPSLPWRTQKMQAAPPLIPQQTCIVTTTNQYTVEQSGIQPELQGEEGGYFCHNPNETGDVTDFSQYTVFSPTSTSPIGNPYPIATVVQEQLQVDLAPPVSKKAKSFTEALVSISSEVKSSPLEIPELSLQTIKSLHTALRNSQYSIPKRIAFGDSRWFAMKLLNDPNRQYVDFIVKSHSSLDQEELVEEYIKIWLTEEKYARTRNWFDFFNILNSANMGDIAKDIVDYFVSIEERQKEAASPRIDPSENNPLIEGVCQCEWQEAHGLNRVPTLREINTQQEVTLLVDIIVEQADPYLKVTCEKLYGNAERFDFFKNNHPDDMKECVMQCIQKWLDGNPNKTWNDFILLLTDSFNFEANPILANRFRQAVKNVRWKLINV